MPAVQRGSAYKIAAGKWGLRWYDAAGVRHRKSPFPSKSAALDYYRDVIAPQLRGEPAAVPDMTLTAFVKLFLKRHAVNVRPRTIKTLRDRLAYAERAYGDVTLGELEGMSDDIAAWQVAKLPARSRYGIMQAFRQALTAAVRWGYMESNPAVELGANPEPAPRTIRAFSRAELAAIAAELSPALRPLPAFVAATGLRPEEWLAVERRDIDRRARVLSVRRTVSLVLDADGNERREVVELAKTTRSRRQIPLSRRALDALDALPARLDTPLLFASPTGKLLDIDNWRSRTWMPAIEAAGIATPARLYDLRSTFASDALAAGVSVFELARIMGTSVEMIERHYGTLLDGAGAGIAGRLDALDVERDRAADDAAESV